MTSRRTAGPNSACTARGRVRGARQNPIVVKSYFQGGAGGKEAAPGTRSAKGRCTRADRRAAHVVVAACWQNLLDNQQRPFVPGLVVLPGPRNDLDRRLLAPASRSSRTAGAGSQAPPAGGAPRCVPTQIVHHAGAGSRRSEVRRRAVTAPPLLLTRRVGTGAQTSNAIGRCRCGGRSEYGRGSRRWIPGWRDQRRPTSLPAGYHFSAAGSQPGRASPLAGIFR